MDPVAAIALWSALFVVSHLVISSQSIRPRLVERIGELPFRGIYSLVAFGTLIPLWMIFMRHKHAGAMLWYLRDFGIARAFTWLLTFAALIMLVASLISPSPGAIGARPGSGTGGVHGMLKLTRHPGHVAFSLFGFAHMLMNGWVGDVIFFGTFPALGILGGLHQDRRKLREIGESYRRFVEQTSFFPGAALISGRQRWSGADMPWIAIGIGSAMAVILVLFHPYLFGGSPLG
ncbi:MAG: hypothetical protein QOG61_1955 [Candidatus Binataceae bacterium]|jgi:uncharacterized membrane protein|nr:hypothetical protein [Candidatus Binataceae bacterium]